MTEKKKSFVQQARGTLEGWAELTRVVEATLVDNLAASAPWLAPLAPAYLAYQAMVTVLVFPVPVALALAAVIEMLGISTMSTTVTFWSYNNDPHQKRKGDPAAPTWLAAGMAAFYMVVVLVVNVLLDSSGIVERTAKTLLSSLSIAAVVTLVLRAAHARRVDEVKQVKSEEKDEREKRRVLKLSENLQKVTEDKPKEPERPVNFGRWTDWRHVPDEERERVYSMRNDVRLVMDEYGVSERTGYNWIGKTEKLFGKTTDGEVRDAPTFEN